MRFYIVFLSVTLIACVGESTDMEPEDCEPATEDVSEFETYVVPAAGLASDLIVVSTCEPGDFVVSGGCQYARATMTGSYPSGAGEEDPDRNGTAWSCEGRPTDLEQPGYIFTYAICRRVSK